MVEKHIITRARELADEVARSSGADSNRLSQLDEVAIMVRDHGELAQVVAYLRNVLEDGGVSASRLEEDFGPVVANCVVLLTQSDDSKESRRILYGKLAAINADDPEVVALIVATAERLARAQECYMGDDKGGMRRLRQDHRDFRQAVYRPGVAEKMWQELTELVAW